MVRAYFDFDDPNPGYKIIQASGELDTRVTGHDENGSAIYGNLSKDNLLPRGVSNVEAQYITDTDPWQAFLQVTSKNQSTFFLKRHVIRMSLSRMPYI